MKSQSSPSFKVPLSPISFLEQAALRHGSAVSVVYGETHFTWAETRRRCLKLASSLSQLSISAGDIVVALAPNIPALYELHFAVPMAGAALCALNTRLDAPTLALVLQQLQPKIIFVDSESSQLLARALDIVALKPGKSASLVVIHETTDELWKMSAGGLHYDDLVEMGEPEFETVLPEDEGDMISVSYTSGSTGFPKGVVYSHKAAYLNSLAQIGRVNMTGQPVFLWTVDMFRCNGWCFTWAMAALGGVNICLRNASAESINEAILTHKVTHLCGAPWLLDMVADAPSCVMLPHQVHLVIAGALRPRRALERVENLGFMVTQAYGMTEALGPVVYTPVTNKMSNVRNPTSAAASNLVIDVRDLNSTESVPRDGKTMGEVMLRGETLMKGYLKNPEAFKGGWFRTGDMGVRAQDGSVVMHDRIKDAIVCGAQMMSSVEIEEVVVSHPMVSEAAVVGGPGEGFEQRAFAFVKLEVGCALSTEDLVRFCEERLPYIMVPRTVFFGSLPLNCTGKVQKFVLRKKLESLGGQAASSFVSDNIV